MSASDNRQYRPAARVRHDVLVSTSRHRARIGLALLSIVWLSARPHSDSTQTDPSRFWSTTGATEYRAIVEAYQDGEVEAAISLLLESKGQGRDVVDAAARTHSSAPEPAIADLLAAAAMLHTDAAAVLAVEGRPQDVVPHLDVARRWLDLLEPSSPPAQSFRRRWYVGAGLLLVEQARVADAIRHLDLALRILPGDVDVLTTAAWIYERFALAPALPMPSRRPRPLGAAANGAIARREGDLKEAASRLTAALATDALAPEAGLRLARVRLLQGQADEARRRLLELTGRSIPPEMDYVARLLLGRLTERDGQIDEARSRFEQAVALVPDGQSARMALAALQHAAGQRDLAGATLDAVLVPRDDETREDPWAAYMNGPLRRGREIRNALRAEVSR